MRSDQIAPHSENNSHMSEGISTELALGLILQYCTDCMYINNLTLKD
jgi:hypothetical protein